MGKKKHQRKKNSNLSISLCSEQNSKDSSFDSFNVSDNSIVEENNVPEKLIVSSIESAGCDKYSKCLKSDWSDVVFLHPSVMRKHNIEDLVLIKGEDKSMLCTAYPLEKLKKTFIVFPKENFLFKYQELVSVNEYTGEVKHAHEILIESDDDIKTCIEDVDQYILSLLCNRYIFPGLIIKWKLFYREFKCTIKKIYSPDVSNLTSRTNLNSDIPEFYVTTYNTVLKLKEEFVHKSSSLDFIGGLDRQKHLVIRYIKRFLEYNISNNSIYCGTLIFSGPSGTGKSLLLESVINEYDIFTEYIFWYHLCAMTSSEVQKELKDIFQRAKDRAPSIIVMDDFNVLCPVNGEGIQKCISKSIGLLLETLDEARTFIIAAINDVGYDSSILQTSKRITETIKFQIPATTERIEIFKKILKSRNHELTFEQIRHCAELAHGFTGKDILEVIKNAQIVATKREFHNILDSGEFLNIVKSKGHNICNINYSDIEFSLKLKKPFIMASNLKIKKVYWSDIGGMTSVKEKLKQLIEWPLKFPDAFKHFNITPSRGVLMYGPPGCSKTLIAKALATECELNFISKNAADLYDKYVGESEKAVRNLFAIAKAKSPCIIFLDEIDALVTGRGSSSGSSGVGNRIVTTLLTEMDGIEELQGVMIIAATNRPDMLDDALVRNGRINHFIYVPLPDVQTREEILKISMRNRQLYEYFDFKVLTEKTEGYSGAEIVNLCNEAALQLLLEDPRAISPVFKLSHFELALKHVFPRTNKEMIKFYENYNAKHSTNSFK